MPKMRTTTCMDAELTATRSRSSGPKTPLRPTGDMSDPTTAQGAGAVVATAAAMADEAATVTADARALRPDGTAAATATTAAAVAAMPRAAVEAARARLDEGMTDLLRPDDLLLPGTADEVERLPDPEPMRLSRDLLAGTATSRAPMQLLETAQTEGTTAPSALSPKRDHSTSRFLYTSRRLRRMGYRWRAEVLQDERKDGRKHEPRNRMTARCEDALHRQMCAQKKTD